MNMEYLLGGGLIVGFVTAFWGKLKELATRVMSLLIVRVKLQGEPGTAVTYWCFKNCKQSKLGERRYGGVTDYVQPEERHLAIAYEEMGQSPSWFWKGWKPLILQLDVPAANQPNIGYHLHVTTIRGLFNLEALIIESMDILNEFRHKGDVGGRFSTDTKFGNGPPHAMMGAKGYSGGSADEIEPGNSKPGNLNPDHRILKWKREDIGTPKSKSPFASLVFPPEIEQLIEEARRWIKSEKWYRSKNIPWRRGWLLYGAPGTGKTSLVRAVGQSLDLPIVSFDLASFSNSDFTRAWKKLMNKTPCIALLEDIDSVFDKRENRLGDNGGGLTFDCLLNCLSGVESADGVLVVVTTNRIECLDEALGVPDSRGISTRPGRIDRAVELPLLSEECRYRLAKIILGELVEELEINTLVDAGEGESGAQFQERCSQIALAKYWQDQPCGN